MSIVVDTAPLDAAPITDIQEQVTEDTTQDLQAGETQQPESIIPEKYAGKTTEDLIEMHQNFEKMQATQNEELGKQRAIIQTLQDAKQAAEAISPLEEAVDFDH